MSLIEKTSEKLRKIVLALSYEFLRVNGSHNMWDQKSIQVVAYTHELYEFVTYVEEHKDNYLKFISDYENNVMKYLPSENMGRDELLEMALEGQIEYRKKWNR